MGAMGLGTLLITGRLAQLQIIDHDQYAREARQIHMSEETLFDRRGALLDRNGYPLAASEDTFDVIVEHRAWEKQENAMEAATKLSAITSVPPEQMVQEVAASRSSKSP